MTFALPPSGTRGTDVPSFLRPLMRAMGGVQDLMFHTGVKVQGRPLLRLTTVGARSGKQRRVVLGWFEDDGRADSWIVVASNGGASRHPGWAYNLAKHPDQASVELRDRTVPASADLITGPERDDVWNRVTSLAPGYGKYTTKTDREIPILRLRARSAAAGP
jgi:deazaflavin-dependent oxidoreductase (nitroreductase family)